MPALGCLSPHTNIIGTIRFRRNHGGFGCPSSRQILSQRGQALSYPSHSISPTHPPTSLVVRSFLFDRGGSSLSIPLFLSLACAHKLESKRSSRSTKMMTTTMMMMMMMMKIKDHSLPLACLSIFFCLCCCLSVFLFCLLWPHTHTFFNTKRCAMEEENKPNKKPHLYCISNFHRRGRGGREHGYEVGTLPATIPSQTQNTKKGGWVGGWGVTLLAWGLNTPRTPWRAAPGVWMDTAQTDGTGNHETVVSTQYS